MYWVIQHSKQSVENLVTWLYVLSFWFLRLFVWDVLSLVYQYVWVREMGWRKEWPQHVSASQACSTRWHKRKKFYSLSDGLFSRWFYETRLASIVSPDSEWSSCWERWSVGETIPDFNFLFTSRNCSCTHLVTDFCVIFSWNSTEHYEWWHKTRKKPQMAEQLISGEESWVFWILLLGLCHLIVNFTRKVLL